MAITVYGIPNCDTVKKARRFLDNAGVEYRFHNFKKDGLSEALAAEWAAAVPHETLINRRGTTWRKLPEASRENLDPARAAALAVAEPSVVKRPVVNWGDSITVGFDPEDWANRLTDR